LTKTVSKEKEGKWGLKGIEVNLKKKQKWKLSIKERK
jgi:hypothetical protein